MSLTKPAGKKENGMISSVPPSSFASQSIKQSKEFGSSFRLTGGISDPLELRKYREKWWVVAKYLSPAGGVALSVALFSSASQPSTERRTSNDVIW